MALTGRLGLLALLGAALVALLPSGWTLVAVEGLLAVGVVVDLALAAPVRPLRLSREGDSRVRLGQPAASTVTLLNPGDRTLRAVVRDAWSPSAGASPRTHTLVVPGGAARRFTTDLLPTRRGDRLPAVVTIRSAGPLGLAARQGRHTVPGRLRVLPPFTSRKHLPERLSRLRQIEGATVAPIRGQGTEFDSLREYVEGDDVRSIDWRATARRSTVVVRTWRPERDRQLVIVLDTGRTSAGRVGDAPRLDAAMDAALLLAALASRAGDRVNLLAHDVTLRATVGGGAGPALLGQLVEAMAPLEPQLVETDLGRTVAEVLKRTRRRSLVVLLTSLDPAVVGEGLLPVLPMLTSRHTVVLASVADSRVAELAADRADALAVYGAAAATGAQLERQKVASRLRRAGVEVVDAVPDELPPRLADTYLALKAAGRL